MDRALNLNWLNARLLIIFASLAAISATIYCYTSGFLVAYGDAESHLNIAKRVVQSLTPGFSQLGGIWLPLPHLMLIPFVYSDFLWRSGLAGAICSGICFIISAVFLYKLTFLITHQKLASLFSFLIFVLNPNLLYLQSTAMTELSLIAFFILSSYFFVKFIGDLKTLDLILAALFGFAASLSRYDGWLLVLAEASVIVVLYIVKPKFREFFEGKLFIFASLAFFGIFLWLLWDFLILGDPLYFSNSPFSANSQQKQWLMRGELPAYKNLLASFNYYLVTSIEDIGYIVSLIGFWGLCLFLMTKSLKRFLIAGILLVPFIFYVVTLYLGQSVIFIPYLTPTWFQWRLFNVRYGVMMVPVIAFFAGYLFYLTKNSFARVFLFLLIFAQLFLFIGHYQAVYTLEDGVSGLSASKHPDAEGWLAKNYDQGLVLMDDYARTVSIIRSGIPMQQFIYVGNKPYWDDSLKTPEKYATWVVIQKDDSLWHAIIEDPASQGRLYKYFQKAYTSPDILIFKRNSTVALK